MATAMDEFRLSLVRGATVRGSDAATNAKEWTAYLVDCGDAMYRTYRGPVPDLQGLTLFQAACSQVRDVVACRLAQAVDEDVAIMFFNRGVCVWQAAGPPTLALLERLDDLVAASSGGDVLAKRMTDTGGTLRPSSHFGMLW